MREQEIRKQFERLYEHARRCCGDTNLISVVEEAVLLATNPGEKGAEARELCANCGKPIVFHSAGVWGHVSSSDALECRMGVVFPARQDNGDALRKIITSLEDRSIVLCNTDASQWKCRLCGAMQDGPGADGKHNVSCPIRDLRELAAPSSTEEKV